MFTYPRRLWHSLPYTFKGQRNFMSLVVLSGANPLPTRVYVTGPKVSAVGLSLRKPLINNGSVSLREGLWSRGFSSATCEPKTSEISTLPVEPLPRLHHEHRTRRKPPELEASPCSGTPGPGAAARTPAPAGERRAQPRSRRGPGRPLPASPGRARR